MLDFVIKLIKLVFYYIFVKTDLSNLCEHSLSFSSVYLLTQSVLLWKLYNFTVTNFLDIKHGKLLLPRAGATLLSDGTSEWDLFSLILECCRFLDSNIFVKWHFFLLVETHYNTGLHTRPLTIFIDSID